MNVFRHSSAEKSGSSSWRRALLLTLVLRIAYSIIAAAMVWVQPVNSRLTQSNALTENLQRPSHTFHYLLFGAWERFDTLWYLQIAAHGYDRPESVVFFPLYPGLIRLLSAFLPPIAGALLISSAASFFLFWGLQELLLENVSESLAEQAVLFCAVWPASFIFFAGYPESLLFALMVWSLYMARENRWAVAIACGIAAALTKALGVIVAVPLLILALRQKKMKGLATLAIPLAAAGFLAWLRSTGHPTLNFAYEKYWHTLPSAPWRTLWVAIRTSLNSPNPVLILNLVFPIAVSILVAISRVRVEYVMFAVVAMLMAFCKNTTPPLQSMVRYLLIVFPAFVGMARLFQNPPMQSRFVMACLALFLMNLGLLWLFLGWSLVV